MAGTRRKTASKDSVAWSGTSEANIIPKVSKELVLGEIINCLGQHCHSSAKAMQHCSKLRMAYRYVRLTFPPDRFNEVNFNEEFPERVWERTRSDRDAMSATRARCRATHKSRAGSWRR